MSLYEMKRSKVEENGLAYFTMVLKTIKIFNSKSLECCLDKDKDFSVTLVDNVSDTNGDHSMFLTKVTYQQTVQDFYKQLRQLDAMDETLI